MQKIAAKQVLTDKGWQNDVTITIRSDGQIEAIFAGIESDTPTHDLLLPAPTNLHSHSFQRAMAGWTEARGPNPNDSFWTWRRLMYRFLDQLTPDQIEAIATLTFMEMLEAGYSAVAEFHYLHHQVGGHAYADPAELSHRIIRAAETAGIGLTLLPVLYQFGGCDARPLEGGQMRFGNTPDQFAALHASAAKAITVADHHIGTAPHSLRAVDRAGLQMALDLTPTGPIHMHLAEQTAEVDEVLAHLGARPTEWLLQNAHVDARWCLIHCTQMSDTETRDLATTGAVAGLCPLTESSLGDGIFNGETWLNSKGKLGIGSDSNIHITLFEELKTLEYSQRLKTRRRAVLATETLSTGHRLFAAACNGGAQAAGRNSGGIRPGALADLIAIETDNRWLNNSTGDLALDGLIFTGHGQDCITDVWSAGRHMVKQGRHIRQDQIIRDFRTVMTSLKASA
ncbi:formimidoylglutamate deiminase [Shimia sediminis]|uniref:formimidoylglutamate deiminase n=1 Tax=Shimia sediminis TaxID=2497945 RepID=UPI000F8D7C8D|nr:formimidoylglutamate deiminase [Shimia sediminis]